MASTRFCMFEGSWVRTRDVTCASVACISLTHTVPWPCNTAVYLVYTAVYSRYTAVYLRYTAVYREYTAVYLPIHSGYTTVYSGVYGRILRGVRPYTHSICCQFQSILTSFLLEFHPFFLCSSILIPGHYGASVIMKWSRPRWSWWRRGLPQVKWSPVGSTRNRLPWGGGMLPLPPMTWHAPLARTLGTITD